MGSEMCIRDSHDPHTENAGETLPDVLSRQTLVFLEDLVTPSVIVDRSRHCSLEASKVHPAFVGVDVIYEGVGVFTESLIVLEGKLDLRFGLGGIEIADIIVEGSTSAAQELHIFGDSTLVSVLLSHLPISLVF